MKKPTPLRRIDATGRACEVANQPERLSSEIVFAASIKLGQSIEEAKGTVFLYEDDSLDPSDVKLLVEAAKELKEEVTKIPSVSDVKKTPASSVNPRNAKRIKQRVTCRDPITHRVTGFEDV